MIAPANSQTTVDPRATVKSGHETLQWSIAPPLPATNRSGQAFDFDFGVARSHARPLGLPGVTASLSTDTHLTLRLRSRGLALLLRSEF